MKDVHEHVVNGVVGVADLNNTFSHVQLEKQAKKHGFKPIYGVRLFTLPDESKQRSAAMPWIYLARNLEGLKEIYQYVSKAYENFFYVPRLNYSDIKNTGNVIIIPTIEWEGSPYIAWGQGLSNVSTTKTKVAITTNNYPRPEDEEVYQLLAGAYKRGDDYAYNFNIEVYPQHIMNEGEWLKEYGGAITIDTAYAIAEMIEEFDLPKAGMVHWKGSHDLTQFFNMSKVPEWNETYQMRLGIRFIRQEWTEK